MKNIKLSDEDKKIINKYNHLLMAVVGDDGLFALLKMKIYMILVVYIVVSLTN